MVRYLSFIFTNDSFFHATFIYPYLFHTIHIFLDFYFAEYPAYTDGAVRINYSEIFYQIRVGDNMACCLAIEENLGFRMLRLIYISLKWVVSKITYVTMMFK